MDFYYIPMACSLASHIVLEEVGADYVAHALQVDRGDMDDPKFRALNPKGFVPVLVTDRGVITENAGILLYLAQSYPEAGLFPSNDPFGWAQVNSFNIFLSNSVHVSFRQLSRPRMFAEGAVAAEALKDKVPEMSHRYFGMIEAMLEDGRTWIHGETYTASDPYLFIYSSYLQWGDRGDPDRFPLVRAHRERVLARPAVQRALASEHIGDPALVFGNGKYLGAIDSD